MSEMMQSNSFTLEALRRKYVEIVALESARASEPSARKQDNLRKKRATLLEHANTYGVVYMAEVTSSMRTATRIMLAVSCLSAVIAVAALISTLCL